MTRYDRISNFMQMDLSLVDVGSRELLVGVKHIGVLGSLSEFR
jgi:hypothetical protein